MTPVIEESQGVKLAGLLAGMGYKVSIADPMAGPAAKAVLGDGIDLADAETAVRNADVVVITVPWPEFAKLPADAFAREANPIIVVDPWAVLDADAIGISARLVRLGRGDWKTRSARNDRAA
jgi:predicted dinucleotide-binding enzyme